jgi:hypothetical protein
VTSRVTGAVCVAAVPIPVTVRGYVPPGVVASVVSVRMTVLSAVMFGGMNAAVAPTGRPLAESVTVSAAEPVAAIASVIVPALPCMTLTVAGDALIEKSAVTTNDTVAVCVADGVVPVIVIA